MTSTVAVLLEWPDPETTGLKLVLLELQALARYLKKTKTKKKQRNRKLIYSTRPLLVYYHFSTVFLPYNGNSRWWMGKWQIILHEGDSKKIMLLQGSDRKIISPKIQVRVSQNILYIHSGCIQWSFPAGKKDTAEVRRVFITPNSCLLKYINIIKSPDISFFILKIYIKTTPHKKHGVK